MVAVNGEWGVAKATNELVELAFGFAAVDGGAGDFVAVEMENGEDTAVGAGVAEEFDKVEGGEGGGGF